MNCSKGNFHLYIHCTGFPGFVAAQRHLLLNHFRGPDLLLRGPDGEGSSRCSMKKTAAGSQEACMGPQLAASELSRVRPAHQNGLRESHAQ